MNVDQERERAQEARAGATVIRRWGIDCTRQGLYLAATQRRMDRARADWVQGLPGYQPTRRVPGLDTLSAKPQTSVMRSTIEDYPFDADAFIKAWSQEGRRPQADPEPCSHDHVEQDDDGQARRFSVCIDCHQEVVLSEPDEDGESFWEEVN